MRTHEFLMKTHEFLMKTHEFLMRKKFLATFFVRASPCVCMLLLRSAMVGFLVQ